MSNRNRNRSRSERAPLLVPNRDRRSNSLTESLLSIKDYVKDKTPSITTLKFIAAIIWAIFAVFVFNLIFLPRTSLSRDYRRLHFSSLTKDETERLFLKSLRDENNIKGYLHHYDNYNSNRTTTGVDYKSEIVKYTIDQIHKFGFSPYTKNYYAYTNEPGNCSLDLITGDGEILYETTLGEDTLIQTPVFNPYSKSGNVTGEFIFANYGSREDYELLNEYNIKTNGTIHIVRNGNLSTAIKLSNAEKSGAIGVVFYSDPYDDGEITVKKGFKPYPEGPARNPSSIERESVLNYNGDPSTPGYSCKSTHCKRKDPEELLPKIPSIPINQIDAEKILKSLNGKTSLNWTGDLEYDYTTGQSGSNLHLSLHNNQNYAVRQLKDIFYEIPGLSKERVIIGTHRDSLTSGAGGSTSGSAILLEISRAFGVLAAKGWRPLRTIVIASFDGEEYGLLGSTEYGDDNRKKLSNNVIAYLNLDAGITGPQFKVSCNPLLERYVKSASEFIPFKGDPEYTLYDYWNDQNGNKIDLLKGGSSHSMFQDYLGVPSCGIRFGSDNTSAIHHRHSDFDTVDWLERFIDPDYKLHNTLTSYIGFLALMLSEHEVIEYNTRHYAHVLDDYLTKYIDDVPKKWLDMKVKSKKQILPLNKLIAGVSQKVNKFVKVSTKFDKRAADLQEQDSIDHPWFRAYKKLLLAINIKVIDNKSNRLDRLFVHGKGLNDRPWLKHILLAPDKENGIEGDFLPGIKEALLNDDLDDFVKWLTILGDCLDDANKNLSF